MIVLDTNVLSELIRPAPDPLVLDWINTLIPEQFCVTAITVAEILYGVGVLPDGKRKATLSTAITDLLDEDFSEGVIPFDHTAATFYAALVVERKHMGQPVSMADAQIAAICLQHNAALATRNLKDFQHTGIDLINPWQAPYFIQQQRAEYAAAIKHRQ